MIGEDSALVYCCHDLVEHRRACSAVNWRSKGWSDLRQKLIGRWRSPRRVRLIAATAALMPAKDRTEQGRDSAQPQPQTARPARSSPPFSSRRAMDVSAVLFRDVAEIPRTASKRV